MWPWIPEARTTMQVAWMEFVTMITMQIAFTKL